MQVPIAAITQRHDELAAKLADPSLDRKERQALQRELTHLAPIISQVHVLEKAREQLEQTKAQAVENKDPEMAELYELERAELEESVAGLEQQLDDLMAPPDEHDDRSVYLEIRAGTGGQEAALFAGDLLKMYTAYGLAKGWKVTVDSASPTDLGGYREVVLHIKGSGVYGSLKRESGVHRVQRVPDTESSGRVHTSTATVAVLPEAEEVDVTIDPSDLRIDTFRASGAGGQHVNVTDSAIRITHIPTGVVVSCQDERSQHKNKAKAMKMLQSRLLAAQVEKQAAEMSAQRKQQVGTGMRSEKVRTYNFPQNRVTDHQVGITLKKLDIVMQGHLDEIIDALHAESRESRRKGFLSRFERSTS